MAIEKAKIITTAHNTCPFCGGKKVENIVSEVFDAEPPKVVVVWKKCRSCDGEFTNVYELNFVGCGR